MSVQRNGGALHVWIWRVGFHVFRHVGSPKLKLLPRWSPVWVEWDRR